MKTNISLPNTVFHAAEKLAKKMGISLSDLYAAALASYITEHENENITDALDRVYDSQNSTMEPELVKMQVAVFEGKQW
jgi:metal-responsive CopG/Arc/MetJ family transcriptional regulator